MTKTIGIREATRADRDAILALRAVVFANEDGEKLDADFWSWEFLDGYAGGGRVFIAEAEESIVGHFAFVPQRYDGCGAHIRGALAVDVMTHPEYRRRKVFTRLAVHAADRIREDFQVVTAFQIRRQVLGGMLAGGWRVVSNAPVLVKPLSLRAIVRELGFPAGARSRRTDGDAADVDASIRPVAACELEQVDALLASPATRQKRSPEFLRWRYLDNPRWRYELDGCFEEGELRAFLVHRLAPLRGIRSLAVVDAGASPGCDDALQRLLRRACTRARERGAAVAAALLSRHHPAWRVVRSVGFIPGPHRFALMLQRFDETLPAVVATAPWSLSWGDSDHL